MFDFSGGEMLFLFAAGIASLVWLVKWYSSVLRASRWILAPPSRATLALTPLLSLLVLLLFLQNWSDPVYVAGHFDYTLLFMLGGTLWMFSAASALSWLGISWRDDAIEQRNPAAVVAVGGAMLGTMLVYAFCNIGNGPTIGTTLIPALVATLTLLVLLAMIEAIGDPAELITVERDLAAGVRMAAFCIAGGAVLGRAMAGDWYSWNDTFTTFVSLGWPVVALVLFTSACDRIFAPTPQRPVPGLVLTGVAPAIVMLIVAAVYVASLGAPEVAPAGQYDLNAVER